MFAKRPYFLIQFCLINCFRIATWRGGIEEWSEVNRRLFPFGCDWAPSMKLKKMTQKAEMFILVAFVQLIAKEIDCNQFANDHGFYNMDQPRYCY